MQCFEDPLLLQQLHTLAHPWYQRLVSSVQNGSVTLEPSVHRRLYYVSQSIGALLPEAPILLPGTCLPRGCVCVWLGCCSAFGVVVVLYGGRVWYCVGVYCCIAKSVYVAYF